MREATLAIGFSGGIDTKKDRKTVPTTQLLALENGIFTNNTSIRKRNGYDALGKKIDGGGILAQPRALGARGPEVVAFTGPDAYSFRPSSSSWSHIGGATAVTHTERPLVVTGTDQSMPDAATTVDGITIAAWEDSRGGIWWSVIEQDGGRVLRAAEQLTPTGRNPRVVHVGSRLHIYWTDAAGGVLRVSTINPDNYLALPVTKVLTADLAADRSYDATRYTGTAVAAGHPAIVAWAANDGHPHVGYVNAAGVLAAPGLPAVAVLAEAAELVCAVTHRADDPTFGDVVAVVSKDGTDVNATVLQAGGLTLLGTGLALEAAASVVRIASTIDADGVVWIWCEESTGSDDDWNHVIESSSFFADGAGGGTVTAGPTVRGHGLVSRGFADASEAYVIVTHPVPFFPYVAVLRAGDAVVVARMLVGSSDGLPVRTLLAAVEQDASDPRVWRWPGLARDLVDANSGQQTFTETSIRMVRLDLDDANAYQSVDYGGVLVVAGSCPLRYDGGGIAELGFHTAPDGNVAAVPAGLGGALTPATAYLYAVAFEEVDAQGKIHLGPMSVGSLVVLGADDTKATLTGPMYRLTGKPRSRIGIYRSRSNDIGDQGNLPDLFRVTSIDPSAVGDNGFILNNPAVDTWTFTDARGDLELVVRGERAYTNAGILSNDPVGLGGVVASGKGRLFFTTPDNPYAIRFTKVARAGYGPETADGLEVSTDAAGGAVTALAVIDDTVIAFKAGSIYGFDGPGPDDNPDASQRGFSPVQLITGDVGCADPRSIAVTPIGIVFRSNRGICLLDRSRAVYPIGDPVELYKDQAIVRACALPGRTMIIFLAGELGQPALVFDYKVGQWSTWTNHEATDGVVAGGRFYYARAANDGRVFLENPESFTDAGREVTLALETAWIKLAGYIAGWQHTTYATFTGDYLSPHTLRVRWAVDYQKGWLEPYDIDVDATQFPAVMGAGKFGQGPFGGASDSLYQVETHISLDGQALRCRIEDVASDGPLGASFVLTELLLVGAVVKPTAIQGAYRKS